MLESGGRGDVVDDIVRARRIAAHADGANQLLTLRYRISIAGGMPAVPFRCRLISKGEREGSPLLPMCRGDLQSDRQVLIGRAAGNGDGWNAEGVERPGVAQHRGGLPCEHLVEGLRIVDQPRCRTRVPIRPRSRRARVRERA